MPIEESVGALAELRSEGKVREIGVSNVFGDQLELARRTAPIVSVQNRYSLMHRDSETEIDDLRARGHGVHAVVAAGRRRAGRGCGAQQALAWLLQRSPAMLPIPGTASVEHLEENVAAATRAADAAEGGAGAAPRAGAIREAADQALITSGCGAPPAARRASARSIFPSRSRTPTTRQPNDSHSARLASFSGKIQPSSVQMPARSDASTSA